MGRLKAARSDDTGGGQAGRLPVGTLAAAAAFKNMVSHNLHGQKLGRKGRDTRDRILAAAAELIMSEEDAPISLSAVARKTPLGMTSLYNYFTDLTELLLAVLEPVMATAEGAFMAMMRERWPDDELGERCHDFMLAFFDFWSKHARLLHLRNSMADNRDQRMMLHRVTSTLPVISLLAAQMDGDPEVADSPAVAMATTLMTGIERSVTVTTDAYLHDLFGQGRRHPVDHYLRPAARLMELAIRDIRASTAGPPPAA